MQLKFKILSISLIRSIFFSFLLIGLDQILVFDTKIYLICLAVLFGNLAGAYLVKLRLRYSALLAISLALYLLNKLTYYTLEVSFAPTEKVFLFFNFFQHFNLIFLIFLFFTHLSFLFWRYRVFLSIEIATIVLSIVALFAAHREYRLDFLKVINNFAWETGYSPLIIITAIGFIGFLFIFSYLFLIRSYPFEFSQNTLIDNRNYPNWSGRIINLITLVVLFFVTYFITKQIFNLHQKASEVAIQNGVGEAEEPGINPLNFDSALGSSNQPAALIRFKSDYLQNPHTPFLYIRESALSELGTNEMVLAENNFDIDITRTRISQNYDRKRQINLPDRQELDHSVYLIANQKMAFAIDYPVSIKPLKLDQANKKFKAAYLATSMVPIYSFEDLAGRTLGNPTWSDAHWKHYTKPHPDQSYNEFANKITDGSFTELNKILDIIEYLNKNAIYTLNPDREIEKDADPTKAFLFGDLRGYCVHFAHATVYLLRALGIPSRIATGYMTDLSQSKDGHILLRMSDRHAWAEVYIQDAGWVPFDTSPEQVEIHAETPVDQNLLDELIDLLGSDEELLKDDLLEGEIEEEESTLPEITADLLEMFGKLQIKLIIYVLLLLILLRKYLLYFSWKITANNKTKLKRLYFALLSVFIDLGYEKLSGETKQEYFKRISNNFNWSNQNLISKLNHYIYSSNEIDEITIDHKKLFNDLILQLNWKQKLRLLLNPDATLRGTGLW